MTSAVVSGSCAVWAAAGEAALAVAEHRGAGTAGEGRAGEAGSASSSSQRPASSAGLSGERSTTTASMPPSTGTAVVTAAGALGRPSVRRTSACSTGSGTAVARSRISRSCSRFSRA
ncbi:hypothetical protein [Rathayibacter sp. VKM Ac-2760]|uniref:hypothetical protein n=1 Tax=Rathayibacter sp. VKM Ac-2760 TaxID=2609253 RepID=UPI00131829D3|nr:hypothetical protein [Rathayibacter sp. VKM Ac-2760]QHC59585.1 hypothetical protein GSU72_14250 [Rathayibacter sp. VKM Ac-2760]